MMQERTQRIWNANPNNYCSIIVEGTKNRSHRHTLCLYFFYTGTAKDEKASRFQSETFVARMALVLICDLPFIRYSMSHLLLYRVTLFKGF